VINQKWRVKNITKAVSKRIYTTKSMKQTFYNEFSYSPGIPMRNARPSKSQTHLRFADFLKKRNVDKNQGGKLWAQIKKGLRLATSG